MLQTDFTFSFERYVKAIPWSLAFIFLTFFTANVTAQGGSMACNDLVQVSLNGDCQADITPDVILEGEYPDSINFEVTISGVSGTIVTTPGMYSVTVTNPTTNNYCWGNMLVEDKLPPQIDFCVCPTGNTDVDCEYLCTDLEAIQSGAIALPEPVVYENCGGYTSTHNDIVMDGQCGGKIFQRTWIFTDGSGNVSDTCTQEFRLNPVDFNDLVRPISPVQLECGSDYEPEDILEFYRPLVGMDSALLYAYPTINGRMISGTMCNIMATKSDVVTDICAPECSNSKQIIRRWVVLDWCNGSVDEFAQIIKASDNTPPTIISEDVTTSVDAWGCEGSHTFDDPIILHDNCSDSVAYRVEGPLGVTITFNPLTEKYTAKNIPMGENIFRYIGSDCCGNEGVDTVLVTVRDLSAPVAIAKQNIVVSLTSSGGEGLAKIYAASVDNGSHDGCTDVHIEIRRDSDVCGIEGNDTYNDDNHPEDDPNDPDHGQYVKFCCDDLTDVDENGVEFGMVKVWLRVWDDGDMDNTFGSAGDNYNETWAMVRVDDKLSPQIFCPADVTIECSDDINDLELTGNATGTFTCGDAPVSHETLSDQRDDCGFGDFFRRFFLTSDPSVRCTQKITVQRGNLFDGAIDWPEDRTTDCLNLFEPDEPTWSGGICSSVGYSLESDTFQFVEGACFKIINRFTVIDWCQYDPNNGSGTEGMWQNTQVIKVIDDDKPTLSNCTDIVVGLNDFNDDDNDGNTCEARNITVTNSAMDNGDCASDWLRWEISVDIDANGIPDVEYSSFVPRNDTQLDDDNNNGIPDLYIAPTMSGEDVSITLNDDLRGPMSNHKVRWTVTDGCGNRESCTTNVMVVDQKAPTPYCVSLSSALMEVTGMVELWAVDFNLNSFDNCTAPEDLLFTFNNELPVATKMNSVHYFKGAGVEATLDEYNAGDAQKWNPAFNSSSLVFGCDDLPLATMDLTVWDEKGNSDFCSVTLTLVDNFGACSGTRISVRGKVQTEAGVPMSDVRIALDPFDSELIIIDDTDSEGNYAFNNVAAGQRYEIIPDYEGKYDEGISTLDLVLIQRYILGLGDLDSPYKIIAADINGDEGVRGSDVVLLRKLILGVDNEMGGNESWLFVDEDHQFADQSDPFPVNYTIATEPVTTNVSKDIVAIKVGDVNLSSSNLNGESTEIRSNPTTLYIKDQVLSPLASQEVSIYSASTMEVAGFQMAIDLGNVELLSVKAGLLQLKPSDYVYVDGILKISYADNASVPVDINDVLFTVEIMANNSSKLSDELTLASDLEAEFYTGSNLSIQAVEMAFDRSLTDQEESFAMFQNKPNPFTDETKISFQLPEAGTATLSIYDITGKNIYSSTSTYDKGLNTITLDKSLIDVNGVLYYRLENGKNVATKKMIQIQ